MTNKPLHTLRGIAFGLLLLWGQVSVGFAPPTLCPRVQGELGRVSSVEYFVLRSQEAIGAIKNRRADPSIPTVHELHLPEKAPQPGLRQSTALSPGLTDPLLEEARQLGVFEDNKPRTADVRERLRPGGRPLNARDKQRIKATAKAAGEKAAASLGPQSTREQRKEARRIAFLKSYIEQTYTSENELRPVEGLLRPRVRVQTGNAELDALFSYVEKEWPSLLRETPPHTKSSLLPAPYPLFVANPKRFSEAYYWDTYFTLMGFLAPVRKLPLDSIGQKQMAAERVNVAQGVVENLLYYVELYGHVPNGNRDYYLTRSQPPFLSSMVREVYDASLKATPARRQHIQKWLRERAFPLLQREYQFWMSKERYDEATGLNHHWDIDLDRPERHGFDRESRLGRTRRDVRAAAESGEDFTGSHEGNASNVAPVLLNSILYKMEKDLAWMAKEVGNPERERYFESQASKRSTAVREKLYNKKLGRYENYNLSENRRIPILIADTFAPLYAGMSTPQEAKAVRAWLKGTADQPGLEQPFGIMSTELVNSPHQWDGNNGWAPHQMMAQQGLLNYGFGDDARRIGSGWVRANAGILQSTGGLAERIDVSTGKIPAVDGEKYPVQTGPFAWTDGSCAWSMIEVLGYELQLLP